MQPALIFMKAKCCQACGNCAHDQEKDRADTYDTAPCVDEGPECEAWAFAQECSKKDAASHTAPMPGVHLMARRCCRSCRPGMGAIGPRPTPPPATAPTTVPADTHEDEEDGGDSTADGNDDEVMCIDKHTYCAGWAAEGECESETLTIQMYVLGNCCRSCTPNTCYGAQGGRPSSLCCVCKGFAQYLEFFAN